MDPQTIATVVLGVAVALCIIFTYIYTVGRLQVTDSNLIPLTGYMFKDENGHLAPYQIFGFNSAILLLGLSLLTAAGSVYVIRAAGLKMLL